MKKLLFALALLVVPGLALAQQNIAYPNPSWFDSGNQGNYFNQLIALINNLSSNHILNQSSPLTGVTETLAGVQSIDVNLTPAGTIAANTVVFPTAPVNGQQVTIFSSQTITALTLTATQTVVGGVTTLAANGSVAYQYSLANTTWYRMR